MLLVTALLSACSPTPVAPTLRAIQPSRGWTGEATDIVLVGDSFFPDVVVDLAGGDGRIEDSFGAWINTDPPTRLDAVQLVDFQTLTATVPEGIEPGTYDVEIETPAGGTATLQYGFTVTDTRADHLGLTASTVAHEAGDPATVTVSLLDPDGFEVRESLEVEVWVESNLDETSATISDSTLLDAATLTDVIGLRGWLQSEGKATFDVNSTREEELYVYARPVADGEVEQASTLQLSFTVGDLANINLSLPDVGFNATAGVEFPIGIELTDAAGNPSTDQQQVVLVVESDCGTASAKVQQVEGGVGEARLTLTEACEHYTVTARVGDVTGTADTFGVVAAAQARFLVGATPSSFTAGEASLVLTITAVDAYDNPVSGGIQPITVTASSGELGAGYTGCAPVSSGYAECVLNPVVAGVGETWTVTDSLGYGGTSSAVTILPADGVEVRVEPRVSQAVAGDVFDVVVGLYDAYGNVVEIEPGDANNVAFADDTGTITSLWSGKQGDDQVFECVITAATDATSLTARIGPSWIEGTALDPIEVINNDLATLVVTPPTTDQVAGVPFVLRVDGYDAYDNAYVHQSSPVVRLADTTGTMTPDNVVLEADGGVWVDVVVTGADPADVVTATQGAVTGRSPGFAVDAAEAASFTVSTPSWVAIDEVQPVEVRVLDEFGNLADSYAGSVDVAGANSCGLATLSTFDGGVATATVTCPTVYLGETLIAVDDAGLSGSSAEFDVVDLDCASPPTASLALDGGTTPVLCLLGTPVDVDADASGSAPGDAPIALYHFDDADGVRYRSPTDHVSFVYDAPGGHRIDLVVVDGDGCAALANDVVYLADGEDEPAGPIDVSVSATSLTNGDPALTVDVAARDCTGDVAAGQTVYVRANLGSVSGTATGAGLAVTLDSRGEASLSWDFTSDYAGEASVYAGTPSGGGIGSAGVTVLGDGVHPHVVSVEPSGRTLATWSTVTVVFDEDIRTPISASSVILVGPSGTIAVSGAVSGNVVTLTPTTPIDGASGVYTLTLTPDIRDLAGGNRLDGQWIDERSSFTVLIGDMPDPGVELTSCEHDLGTFTPDGDPGAGAEVDSVSFTPVATSTAAWWWLDVTDIYGDRVRSDRAPGSDTTLGWDGRGDDGFVVDEGRYSASLYAVDADGNLSAACTHSITVAQRLEVP